MMADSFEIKFDTEGRIVLPESLISFLKSRLAIFKGIGRSF